MAQYSRVGAAPRIIVLLLLLMVFLLGGIVWFDYLGIFDAKDTFFPVLEFLGLAPREEVATTPEDPFLLLTERQEKRMEALQIKEAELTSVQEELQTRAEELDLLAAELAEKEENLNDREKSFNDRVRLYENKRANLIQNAENLTNMRPEEAVAVLLGLSDQEIIDTMRVTQELADQAGELSLVPVWLARFPAERAAEVMRKMAMKPKE